MLLRRALGPAGDEGVKGAIPFKILVAKHARARRQVANAKQAGKRVSEAAQPALESGIGFRGNLTTETSRQHVDEGSPVEKPQMDWGCRGNRDDEQRCGQIFDRQADGSREIVRCSQRKYTECARAGDSW